MEGKYLLSNQKNKLIAYLAPPILALLAIFVKIYWFRYTGYSIPFLCYFLVSLLSGIIAGSKGVFLGLFAIAICTFTWLIPLTDGAGRYTIAELIIFLSEGIAISMLFRSNEQTIRNLNKSKNKYRRIIDQSAEALLLCDHSGQVNYASSAATRLLNCNNEELVNMPLQHYVHPEERPQFSLVVLRLKIRGEGTALLQQRMLCGNGEWRWTECCINNLLRDRLVGAIVVQVRDITHRITQEKHQEDFLNLASHELKLPVTSIRGFLQIATKRWTEGKIDDHHEYLKRIYLQTDKLLGLIDDMLNITRLKAGGFSYHFKHTDISVCLQEAADAVKAATPGRDIELCIQADLPLVQADQSRIGQVITNLLTNALKYSPGNDPVKATLYQKNNWLEVAISDNGIGISSEKLDRVFDRFYRVDTLPKGKFDGLGLGLFIAAEIVRKHQGHIWVDSEEGKGSIFHFSLPLA